MATLTAAERKRRSRAHLAGDHTLCDKRRCDGTGAPVTPVTRDVTKPVAETTTPTTPRPPRLDARGRRLWDELTADGELSGAERELATEACRLVDRLERLDRALAGDGRTLIELAAGRDGEVELIVIVDRALAEARQQQLALKAVLAELRPSRAGRPRKDAGSRPAAGAPGAPVSAGAELPTGVGDLSRRIRERAAS